MRRIALFSSALLIGVVSGYHVGKVGPGDSTTADVSETNAVTFTGRTRNGDGEELLSKAPRGSVHSRTRLLTLLRQANESDDWTLREAVLREWSRSETLDGISALFDAGYRNEGWQLLVPWAKHHPATAAEFALSLGAEGFAEREYRSAVLSNAVIGLLEINPEQAIAILKRGQSEGYSINIYSPEEISRWSAKAKRQALEAISAVTSPYLRAHFADQFLGQSGIPPRQGVAWIEEYLPLSRREQAYETALRPWLAKDPESAAEFMTSRMDGTPESRVLLRQFIRMMYGKNRTLLVSWMKEQDRELLRDAAPLDWIFQSPENRQSLADELGPGFEWLEVSLERSPTPPIFSSLEESDLPDTWPPRTKEEAGAWITHRVPGTGLGPSFWTIETMNETLGLLVGNLQNLDPSTAKNTAKRWAKHDPHAAIEWAAQLPDHLMIETAETALADWFTSEPTAALEYVDQMEPGEFRSYAVARIAEEWFDRERETAVQWVNAMPLGFDRDIGKQLAAETFLYQNAKRSYLNANAIGNRVLREESLENTFRHWLRKEPQVAVEYLQQANMNEALRSSLKNLSETRGR